MENRKHQSNYDNNYEIVETGLTYLHNDFAREHPETLGILSKHQLIYSVAGLILGFVCIIGGIVLFLNGIVGSTSWSASFLGAESKINDAAPGAVLFIVGLFVVLVTRYVFKVHK